ncbi:PREDICTED: uncharacterized protein LOC109206682 [Nicotiana attenuata]|uniref:uncharacterized protein LOC109206682 n=1 Tax=Nicotiana attenuata TaxID=49451 RepID=UPI000904A2EE|nr:PREDICTED: uncharacterized protein LOC109206682 [Nicotiana attenuata]
MSGPSFSLFSDSQSPLSRNPSSSHVENTTENVELEGGKGKNINAASVDETPYLSLPDTNSEPVIGGVSVTDKGKGKVVEDSELGESRRESVRETETQPVDLDCSDDSQLKKRKIGVAPKKLYFALDDFVRDLVFRPVDSGGEKQVWKEWDRCWDFLVPIDLDYKPKVDWDTNCHVIHQLKANLSKRQLRLFKKTCFGYFLDLPPVIVQIRVMHHLLMREVHHEVKNEMRFVVNDSRLRFGLGEFALVTGLKCKGDTSIESIAENRLISKYFGTASVTFAQLADCFKKKKWETDDDALKIAVLYFVNSFLFSQLKTKAISRSYIDLVESGDFNNYPWGIDVYKATIDSCSNKFQDKPSFYRLGGFPLALQTWLYECCPSLDGHFADHLGNKLPRILNWVVMGQIPNERVALRMCSLQREQLKNITPTDDEKKQFDVRGLSFEIEVECTDSKPSQPDSFQVFGTQLPKTQSMPESTGGDSQPTDAEVMKELQALKLFVENKFEEVLATIGKQSMKSMKPEGNSAHKQQYNDPDFREMHNDYDQFESGHVGNDPVVIGDSTPKAPSISGFAGVGQDGCATGVNVKNVTASDGVVNEDLPSAPFVNEHDFGFDSNFDLSASAIDQITAITQQATYKQSSHDVKKSGPAPLPSGIPVQTRADVVIESNTAPQACRVDGVGQVDVGGSNVNLPSAPCQHGGDLHLDSDFEYTDSQLDQIAAITQGGRCNVNQSGNELTTGAVNKSKPDQSVSRSIVQIQTDVETTPAVLTRKRRPAAVKQSPYRNDWQSGVSAVGGSSKVIKGRFPFVNDISETVNFKLTTAFSNFVEANMQLGEEVYLPADQKLEPCFDFGVEQIDDKMFFHTLNYSGRPLSSSHLNIIFYYLRKKAKHGINMPIKVTTTDTLFNNIIQRVFKEFVKGGKQDHLIDRSDDIMQYMKGFRMHCNTPWHQVDHVLFPINLAEIWHWILGCVSFHKRCFYVYDSLRSRKHKKAIQKMAEAYAVLIPLFLVSIEFYNQRSDIVVENGLHMGKNLTDPFEIELITNLPTQQNSDCGVYVACFAEYIIEDLPIPVANFDVDGLRARFGILLWHYGRNKQLNGESSES